MADDNNEIERHLTPTYDRKGNPEWRSVMTPPDNSIAVIAMVPDRIIPVIFVPGIMGSNLRGVGKSEGVDWRLDSGSSMKGWLIRGPEARKRHLVPSHMEVDPGGTIPDGTQQQSEELRRRGWGEVGAMSYAPFLLWLENALNDHDAAKGGLRDQLIGQALGASKGEAPLGKEAVSLSYRYRLPVHACGYNWLDSNVVAAERLKLRINQVIARYRSERKRCEKVIVVTHSMGGLVARHCSEVLGMRDKIFGIVHGVMPAIGAAAVYRRFKSGTEGDWIPSEVLGNDAAEMTAVMSTAPGPLQLLPTPEYGNHWLKIKDGGQEYSFPKTGDPYGEIYTVRGKWWSMCDDQLANPLNREINPTRRQAQVDVDWTVFARIIKRDVQGFHIQIAGKYHPTTHAFYGSSRAHRAYGTVTWTASNSAGEGWWRGDRPADVLNADALNPGEIKTTRNVATRLGGTGWKQGINQTYTISEPDESGDGTVPNRSGVAPTSHVQSLLQVSVEHEPAFNHTKGEDNLHACRFTLRAIVQIAQAVQQTSLKYE